MMSHDVEGNVVSQPAFFLSCIDALRAGRKELEKEEVHSITITKVGNGEATLDCFPKSSMPDEEED